MYKNTTNEPVAITGIPKIMPGETYKPVSKEQEEILARCPQLTKVKPAAKKNTEKTTKPQA